MASPTISVANFTVNQGDTYVLLASDFTGADSDTDFDHYEVAVLPTHGVLQKLVSSVWTDMALLDTFTEANLTAAIVRYVNDGLAGTDNSFAVKAVDAANNKSANGVTTVTVTDGSWLLSYVSPGMPSAAFRFSQKTEAQAQESRLETGIGGTATTVFLPAAVVSGLPLNYFHGLDLLVSTFPAESDRHTAEVEEQARKLVARLNWAENADLKTLVDTWGSALELEAAGRATLVDDKHQRYLNQKREVEQIPTEWAREFPLYSWWEVLDRAAALI